MATAQALMPTSTTATRPCMLSVVACSRNDGHGENLVERMQLFVDGIADQASRYAIDCELVLVEWNPPAGAPGLAEVLRYPDAAGRLTSRVVTVPAHVHARIPHSDALPLYQMIAKNAGIRRARGSMVLSTNIDILLPDALMGWLAAGGADLDALYRCDRADITVPFGTAAAADLPSLRAARPMRVNRRDGIYDADGHRVVPLYRGPLDLARYRWMQWRHPERPRQFRPAQPGGATPTRLTAAAAARKAWRLTTLRKPHLNACGDFTMMSRDNWHRVGAHAEWPMYSWNLDALLLYQARAHGIREVDLPDDFTVLHMDHSRGSGWTPDGAADLFERMTARGVPVLTDDGLVAEAHRLGIGALRRRRPRRYTGAAWGYGDLDLPEQDVTGHHAAGR